MVPTALPLPAPATTLPASSACSRWRRLSFTPRSSSPAPIVVLGNVGEEGEGDLRGVRHFYEQRALAGRIAAHIVLDGAGADSAVTQALGSRRFQVTINGPGGHSFTDAGTPNPIAAIWPPHSPTVARTPLPEKPSTTLNIGTIHGGTSVNSIPESATASIDFRSTSSDELLRLEVALHRAVEDAVDQGQCRREIITARAIAARSPSRSKKLAIGLRRNSPAILRSSKRFALSIGISASRPIFASDQPMPTFPLPSAFRHSPWVQAEMAAARIRSPSGTATRIARLACVVFFCSRSRMAEWAAEQ